MIKLIRKACSFVRERYAERRARQEAKRRAEEQRAEQQRVEDLAEAERRNAERRAARRAEAAELHKALELARQARLAEERAARKAAHRQAIEEEAAEMRRWQDRWQEEAAEMRRWLNPFQVGGKYENRKGSFTVLALSGDEMRFRWDTGEEVTDSVASQARIFRNMTREQAVTHAAYESARDCVKCARCGAYIYSDNAQYIEGKPYGSTCIRHEIYERGRHR